jgi:hypothetical protein
MKTRPPTPLLDSDRLDKILQELQMQAINHHVQDSFTLDGTFRRKKLKQIDTLAKEALLELIGKDDKPNIGHHDDSDWEWCTTCDSLTYEGENNTSWCLCHQKNKWRAELRQRIGGQ